MKGQTDLFETLGISLKPETKFFNTTKLKGESLKTSKKNSKSQDMKILDFFRLNKDIKMSPSYVHKSLFNELTPLSSIRRAITNLSNSGYLLKCKDMIEGNYGKLEHTWKFNN